MEWLDTWEFFQMTWESQLHFQREHFISFCDQDSDQKGLPLNLQFAYEDSWLIPLWTWDLTRDMAHLKWIGLDRDLPKLNWCFDVDKSQMTWAFTLAQHRLS